MKIAAFSKTYEGRTVLDFPGLELQPGKIYAEHQLNEVLLQFHEDYCTLRRDMISEGLLKREGSLYQRVL